LPSPNAERRFRIFELVIAVLAAATLVWTVATWRGWIGGEQPLHPVRSLFLLSYFTLMSASWVVRRRSARTADALGFGAVAAFVLFVANVMTG
jgi:hypothetical protein